jgi:hypothetical protein
MIVKAASPVSVHHRCGACCFACPLEKAFVSNRPPQGPCSFVFRFCALLSPCGVWGPFIAGAGRLARARIRARPFLRHSTFARPPCTPAPFHGGEVGLFLGHAQTSAAADAAHLGPLLVAETIKTKDVKSAQLSHLKLRTPRNIAIS